MNNKNHNILSKNIVVKNLQSMKVHKFEVWDLNSIKDRKDLLNELEKKITVAEIKRNKQTLNQ